MLRRVSANASTGALDRSDRAHGSGICRELSRLGFGTSALMSRVNRRDSIVLLQTAFDRGLTHFDTARSYGFGEAEKVVGEAFAGRRDQITITTKVGIVPPPRAAGLTAAAKAMARGLLRVAPGMRAQLRQRAGALVRAERFDTASMTESLHTSLRQLRTDSIDFLLLHEPSSAVLTTEPLAFLERARSEGKVRSFGIAATPEVANFALEQAPGYAGVLQFPNGVFTPHPDSLNLLPSGAVFTHSALGTRFDALRVQLLRDARMAARWSETLGVDVTEPGTLARLALHYALAAVPHGVVLFTSTKPAHVRENAAALETSAAADQLRRLKMLAEEWSASTYQPVPSDKGQP